MLVGHDSYCNNINVLTFKMEIYYIYIYEINFSKNLGKLSKNISKVFFGNLPTLTIFYIHRCFMIYC